LERAGHGHDGAFGVAGAAAVEAALDLRTAPGIVPPLRRVLNRHDVKMPVEANDWCWLLSAAPGRKRREASTGSPAIDCEPECAKRGLDEIERSPGFARKRVGWLRRADRLAADQVPQQIHLLSEDIFSSLIEAKFEEITCWSFAHHRHFIAQRALLRNTTTCITPF
jgi:hypothetical protein